MGVPIKIPALHEAIEKLVGDKVCKRYNSDECVVKGAAISAGTLSGDVVDVLLLDTLNLSLGMETTGGCLHDLLIKIQRFQLRKVSLFFH